MDLCVLLEMLEVLRLGGWGAQPVRRCFLCEDIAGLRSFRREFCCPKVLVVVVVLEG
jgi:hypothetical protein